MQTINKQWEYIANKNGKYYVDFFEAPFNDFDTERFPQNKYKYHQSLNNIFRKLMLEGQISNANVADWCTSIFKVNSIKFIWFTQFNKPSRNEPKHATVRLELANQFIKEYHNIETTQSFIKILNNYTNPVVAFNIISETLGKAFLLDLIIDKKGHKEFLDSLD